MGGSELSTDSSFLNEFLGELKESKDSKDQNESKNWGKSKDITDWRD